MRPLKFNSLSSAVFAMLLSATTALHAQDEIAEAIASAEPTAAASASKIRPLTVATGLADDTMITGTLTDSTAIDIKTAFGEASIPLSEVAGIRFPGGEDTSTTVVMLNGDSITGATDLKFVSVETSWGSAKINGQNIATMLFVPGLKWTSMDSLGGKRWTLIEATANAASLSPSSSEPSNVRPAGGIQSRPANPTFPPSIPNRQPASRVGQAIPFGQ